MSSLNCTNFWLIKTHLPPFSGRAGPGPVGGRCLIQNQFLMFRQTKNQFSAGKGGSRVAPGLYWTKRTNCVRRELGSVVMVTKQRQQHWAGHFFFKKQRHDNRGYEEAAQTRWTSDVWMPMKLCKAGSNSCIKRKPWITCVYKQPVMLPQQNKSLHSFSITIFLK